MLQFYVNQKFFTLFQEDFTILEGGGAPIYKVEGQALWSGKRLTVSDMQGNVQFILNRRFFSFLTAIDIYDADKNPLALFREKFHIGFKQRCYIKSQKGDRYDLEGNFFGINYEIYKAKGGSREGDTLIATVEKDFIEFGDKYRVNVLADDEALTVLSIVLCIDMFRVVKQARSSN